MTPTSFGAGIGGDVAALKALQTDVAAAAQQLGLPRPAEFPFSAPHRRRPHPGGYVREKELRSRQEHDQSSSVCT